MKNEVEMVSKAHLEPDHLEFAIDQVAALVQNKQQVARAICFPWHPVPVRARFFKLFSTAELLKKTMKNNNYCCWIIKRIIIIIILAA